MSAPAEHARALEPGTGEDPASARKAPLAVHSQRSAGVGEAARPLPTRRISSRNVKPEDLDFFELHDAHDYGGTEPGSVRLAERGKGVQLALDGETLQGACPSRRWVA